MTGKEKKDYSRETGEIHSTLTTSTSFTGDGEH